MRGIWGWIALQLGAVAAGIWLGITIFDAVAR